MPTENDPNDLPESDFEKQRLANIAERDALLRKLTQDAHSSGLFNPLASKRPISGSGTTSANPPKKKKTTPTKRVKKEEESANAPRRVSSRLRGIAAGSEIAQRKSEEEHEAMAEVERAKKVRKSDSFSFGDMVVSGRGGGGGGEGGGIGLVGGDVVTKGVARPYERTFGVDDVKRTGDKELKALREEMSGLRLWDQWEPNRIKLTPERIYTMTFHPSETKPLIFAGDKMGHLGVLDASQQKPASNDDNNDDNDDNDPDPILTTLKPHTRTISSMHIHPSKPTHLYTSSYDSSIREMDLEKTTSVERYAPPSPSTDDPISALDMSPADPNSLFWTTLNGSLGHYDLRTPQPQPQPQHPHNESENKNVTTWQLSDKKIGGFSLYPSHPHYLATASLDRFMRLWDLRKLDAHNPVPVGEHENRLSVSHAAFNSAGQVATSSYDDSLKIYDFGTSLGLSSWGVGRAVPTSQMQPRAVVRHNCQTGRWVTILRPQWQQNPQSPIQRFCIGNMNRFVDIYAASGDQLAQLGGDGITAVPAVAVMHRSRNWVVGGTASGKVALWM